MELLVNNKIISLDLPVDQVYKKIWCNGGNDSKDPMKVVYRMRGLLGDATEDMIENLDSGKGLWILMVLLMYWIEIKSLYVIYSQSLQ